MIINPYLFVIGGIIPPTNLTDELFDSSQSFSINNFGFDTSLETASALDETDSKLGTIAPTAGDGSSAIVYAISGIVDVSVRSFKAGAYGRYLVIERSTDNGVSWDELPFAFEGVIATAPNGFFIYNTVVQGVAGTHIRVRIVSNTDPFYASYVGAVAITPSAVAERPGIRASAIYTSGAYNGYARNAINGERQTGWSSGGIWHGSPVLPATLIFSYFSAKTISTINVFTVRENQSDGSAPNMDETCSTSYGATGYDLDYWNGTSWVNLVSITGNNKLWRQFTFSPISTTKIRLTVNAVPDGYARIAELECF